MNKNYVFGLIIGLIFIALFSWYLSFSDEKNAEKENALIPKIGQKLWTYHMNKHIWREYNKHDEDDSKDTIILQVQEPVGNGGYTSYHILTGNGQVPKEDVWIGEGSEEFLIDKKLYSYYPKTFEFYEIIFNGVQFVPRKLKIEEVEKLLKGYEIIKVSELKKNKIQLKRTITNNKFMVINDGNINFYKYYIIPNDSKKMEIDRFSNQSKVSEKVEIRIQRLEGCSKAYPCYDINIE